MRILEKFNRKIAEWDRRRQMVRIRRKFASCGYPLDDMNDSQIEAALTHEGERRIDDVSLTAKSIYFALRRLTPDGEPIRGQQKTVIKKKKSRRNLLWI